MLENLFDKSTVKRRKTAIDLRKQASSDEICDALLKVLKLEHNNKSQWQTQFEIIKTIGLLKCTNSIEYIEDVLIGDTKETNILVMASATALVRLKRKDLHDASDVIKLIQTGNHALIEGALQALGYDKMVPSDEQQNIIISICFNAGEGRQRGLTDPRYGLAAACAGWYSERVIDFLNFCLKSNDVPLIYVAENSLKRKYVKLR